MASPYRLRGLRQTTIMGFALATALVAAGCAKSADRANSGASTGGASNTAAQQQVASSGANGPGCTADKYGAPKVDLKTATVGFSQSESTSNPFRATETSSITAEAQRL